MSVYNSKPSSKKEFEPTLVDNNEGGLLSKLFRTILNDTNKVEQIPLLIQRYYERETRLNDKSPNISKIKNKSTVLANAKLGSMSIKVFMSLLRDLFCIKRIRLTIELEWPDGKTSAHQVESALGHAKMEMEDPENETISTEIKGAVK